MTRTLRLAILLFSAHIVTLFVVYRIVLAQETAPTVEEIVDTQSQGFSVGELLLVVVVSGIIPVLFLILTLVMEYLIQNPRDWLSTSIGIDMTIGSTAATTTNMMESIRTSSSMTLAFVIAFGIMLIIINIIIVCLIGFYLHENHQRPNIRDRRLIVQGTHILGFATIVFSFLYIFVTVLTRGPSM